MDAPRTEAAITAACNAFAERGINSGIEQAEVAEEDWAESWKEHFHIERFGQHLVVVPTWRRFDPQSGDITIALDPGMAFGTGQHETTRMCLEALESAVRRVRACSTSDAVPAFSPSPPPGWVRARCSPSTSTPTAPASPPRTRA